LTWSERIDRAFVLRREELLHGLVADGGRVIEELDAVVDSVATKRALAYVGTGVVAGAWMTMTRAPQRNDGPACRSTRPRISALSVLRLISFGAGLLGWLAARGQKLKRPQVDAAPDQRVEEPAEHHLQRREQGSGTPARGDVLAYGTQRGDHQEVPSASGWPSTRAAA
jgi:hypothetical protein